ncbi:MAG TPA: flagella basal body P-ring formation protein FlgA [Alloacidobacterium sp.]|nr:flagella basal body P-ring formation protein FlgA [Alloacidobacterium sp.]
MRRFLIGASALVVLLAMPLRASVCNTGSVASQAESLRVDHYITDGLLHRRWAVAMDCAHPDRPWTLLDVPWQGAGPSALRKSAITDFAKAAPLIPAGAKVRLWSTAGGANIDLSGTALEAGAVGQTIHVRTGQRGTVLEGRVCGAGSVELSTSDRWQKKQPDRWNAQ